MPSPRVCARVFAFVVVLLSCFVVASPASAQTTIALTVTQTSTQIPGTRGTGGGASTCPDTTINTAGSVTVTLPSQYGSIAEALAAGYVFTGTGNGSGTTVTYQGGSACTLNAFTATGTGTFGLAFSQNAFSSGVPASSVAAVAPSSTVWTVTPTSISYNGVYIQPSSLCVLTCQVGTISFSINGDIGTLCSGRITAITPNQGVDSTDFDNDARIDLVANRATVVRLTLDIGTSCSDTDTITVRLKLNDNAIAAPQTQTALAWRQAGKAELLVIPDELAPGFGTLSATLSGAATDSMGLPVQIRSVPDISYIYFHVDYVLPCYVISPAGLATDTCPSDTFNRTADDSGDFVKGVFPVSFGHFTNMAGPEDGFYLPSADSFLQNKSGAINDAQRIWSQATQSGANRVVAVVPPDWFAYHGRPGVLGVVYGQMRKVAFVRDGQPHTSAHELGHTYGFGEGYENPFGTCCLFWGTPIDPASNPTWVQYYSTSADTQRQFNFGCSGFNSSTNCTLDYMACCAPSTIGDNGEDLYTSPDPARPGYILATERWTTQNHFTQLFKRFLSSSVDPAVLLLAGTLSQDGTATLDSLYRAPQGELSVSESGDSALRVSDVNGNVLWEVSFLSDFTAYVEPYGSVPESTVPFGFVVPDLPAASSVEIVRNGTTIASVHISTKLLADAVKSIPDYGFDRNPSQRRNALLNKISAMDAQLSAGAIQGARTSLQNDIEKCLQDWIVSGYTAQTPLQYTKDQIIALVEELILRLDS